MKIGDRQLGPEMWRFVRSRISAEAVNGKGPGAAIDFLTAPNLGGRLADSARAALKWCDQAITAVRHAADPNPYREADEETIAAVINEKLSATKGWPRK